MMEWIRAENLNKYFMVYYSISPQSKKNEKGSAIGNLLIVIGIAVLTVFYLILNNSMVADNYRLDRLYQELSKETSINQDLQVQVDQLSSLPHLQKAAQEMGMIEAVNPEYVKISSSKHSKKIVAEKR